jgi:hypothetical protein
MRLAGAGGVAIGEESVPAGPAAVNSAVGPAVDARGAAGQVGQPPPLTMKPTFTQKEYQRLLELVHLGMWVVTAYQGEETAAAKRYFDLDQKLLELATPAGVADLVEKRPDDTLQPSPKLADDERVREIQGDFTNDAFWHELVARLADRDYASEQAKRSLSDAPGVEPPPTAEERIKELEDVNWREFEQNDLANVIVLRGGGKG